MEVFVRGDRGRGGAGAGVGGDGFAGFRRGLARRQLSPRLCFPFAWGPLPPAFVGSNVSGAFSTSSSLPRG